MNRQYGVVVWREAPIFQVPSPTLGRGSKSVPNRPRVALQCDLKIRVAQMKRGHVQLCQKECSSSSATEHGYEGRTATADSDVVQSGRPIFDDFFQHLWPYIGNNTANVVFQMVKRLWLIRIDQ
ncbi:hypothetical protein TNCV_523851 [Trichonephila clavipes]|nr:hypothetical protein TNCV_523851 [Trichonephila clavipes]